MNTLNRIGQDILEAARAANVSKSERISIRQINSWIVNYRAFLIAQQVDKGYQPSETVIQSLNCFAMEVVDRSECCVPVCETCYVLRGVQPLPKLVKSKTKGDLLMSVTSVHGKPYQLVTEMGAYWRSFRPFTGKHDIYAFLKNDYIYLVNSEVISMINCRGIFENPFDVANVVNSCTNTPCFDIESNYPINSDMIPTIKDLIFTKELKIMLGEPSDKSNNASPIVTPNIEKQEL